MPKLGKGDRSWKRVSQLIEALLDYELNNSKRVSYLHVSWKEGSTHLTVQATLEALRHLLKDKDGFKPTPKTSEKQARTYIGEVLTHYLGEKGLNIFVDHRPDDAKQGNPNWSFTLKLWSKDKDENLRKLVEEWGDNPPSISIEINSESEEDSGQTREKRVIGVESFPAVPVWKGRDQLIEELKAKLGQNLKVLALIGQGGIGKTSVAVKLVEAVGVDLSTRRLSTDCFYENAIIFRVLEGTSFDDVAEFLLDGLEIVTPELLKTAEEKIGKIIQGLAQGRYLVVLDNVESILQSASDSQPGRAISPEWGKLLNALVYQQHSSQIVLTSREVPADLSDTRYEGLEPDSELVHIETLSGVKKEAGVEILKQRQLKDKPEDLQWISERVEGHVFLLTQVAAIGKGKPGYLRKHPEWVTKNAAPILKEQLARQSEAARDLLKRMCVLRVPIDGQGLTFLRLYTDKEERFEMAAMLEEPAELTEKEIKETDAILERLVDSSLVQRRYDEDKYELVYDLHRVIVEFLQAEYKEELPNLLESAYKFYCMGNNVEDPKILEDLRPVLEAHYFAFQLKKYSEASNILMGILEVYLKTWGYWSSLINLYEQILYKVDDERPYYLQRIGSIYRDFGNWKEAERFYLQALEIWSELGNRSGMASSWGVLGDIERYRGNWDAAERLYLQSLEVRTELGNRFGMATSWGQLGVIEHNRGNWDEAERLYRQRLEVMIELGDRSGMATSWGSLGYIECNRGNWDEAEQLYLQSLEVMTELGDRFEIARIWGVLGDIERNRGNWDEAEQLYLQSLEVMTELGDRSGIATLIGCLGENELARGNLDAAEPLLKEALAKFDQLKEVYKIAEANYDLAKLYRQRGAIVAQNYYNTAYQIFQQLGAAKDLERIEREWNTQ